MSESLDDVAAALAAIRSDGEFAVEMPTSSADLHLEVEGVGALRFPISATAAKKLCAVARPAPFGRRDQTLLDPSVRDTWEIPARKVKIDPRAWQPALGIALDVLRERLGIPSSGKLRAVLDKLLVYGPGQFFAPHQDSERSNDMVGSLVVTLPSQHTGGEFVVEHQGETKVFTGAGSTARDLSLLAFYADCRHEVRRVTSGYRVTLTYRLLHPGRASTREPIGTAAVERLCTAVKTYFETPIPDPYSGRPPMPPERLVYLLDHQYTEKSLAWTRLKNADRRRVAALRQSAERLDCEVYLALADVHEIWSCMDDEPSYRHRRWRYDDDEESDPPRTPDDYELTDLIDTEFELRHWISVDGRPAPRVSRIGPDEVCSTRATEDVKPFQSEHEGYMGNYGNTVDRWYHRAALVMWPRERNFVLRARASAKWAVGELAKLVKRGEVEQAQRRTRELVPFWDSVVVGERRSTFDAKLLAVAGSLLDERLALKLLSPRSMQRLTDRAIAPLVALVEQYGLAWSKHLFQAWTRNDEYAISRQLTWLPGLCRALCAAGADTRSLAMWLLKREAQSFHKRQAMARRELWEDREPVEHTLDDLAALLESAAIVDAVSTRDHLVAMLLAPTTGLPALTLGALLKKLREGRTATAVQALGLCALYRGVGGMLDAILSQPPRDRADWSIEPPRGCRCARCRELAKFLRDSNRIEYAWPLAGDGRQHVEESIARNDLPVGHVTVRQGSPHTLVLTKQAKLFARADALRAKQATLAVWLARQEGVFCGGPGGAERRERVRNQRERGHRAGSRSADTGRRARRRSGGSKGA